MAIITARPVRLQIVRCSLLFALCLCACTDVGLGVPGTGTPLPPGGLPPAQTLEGGAQIQLSASGWAEVSRHRPGDRRRRVQPRCMRWPAIPRGCGRLLSQPGRVHSRLLLRCQSQDERLSGVGDERPDPPPEHRRVEQCIGSDQRPDLWRVHAVPQRRHDVRRLRTSGCRSIRQRASLPQKLNQINTVNLSDVTFSGCAAVSNLATIVTQVLDSLAANWITDGVTPALNAAISTLLPAPLELAAVVDLPALLLTGPAASNGSAVETRIVPGGYVRLQPLNFGLSLGVVTGFNSDADPQTRSVDLVSEPDACVAGLTAPDLSLPPFAFSTTTRGSFALLPAGTFVGAPPIPANDLLVGVSRSALDLAGHHMVASGGMCLTLDAARAAFVRRDMLDDLLGVPLAAADAELRFVVRPQQGIRFTVGTGTDPSPHLSAAFDGLQIDVDTVSAGTATPALTLTRRRRSRVAARHAPRCGTSGTSRIHALGAHRRQPGGRGARLPLCRRERRGSRRARRDHRRRRVQHPRSRRGNRSGFGASPDSASTTSPWHASPPRVTTFSPSLLRSGRFLPTINPPAPTPQPLSTTLVLPTPAELRAALLAGDSAGLPTVHVELPDHATVPVPSNMRGARQAVPGAPTRRRAIS